MGNRDVWDFQYYKTEPFADGRCLLAMHAVKHSRIDPEGFTSTSVLRVVPCWSEEDDAALRHHFEISAAKD